MTLAGMLFLAAVIAAFAFFMALLAYGLAVAGESAETAPPAAGAAAAPKTRRAARRALAEPAERRPQMAADLEDAA